MAIDAETRALFTDEFMMNPYPEIARLRAEDPVHWVPELGCWFVTRHDDVKRLLNDPDIATPDRRAWEGHVPPEPGSYLAWVTDNSILALSGAEHARVRRLVSKAFTPKAIARMEDQIREVVARFAAPLAGRTGVVDLMGEYTEPIPNTVISRITGIPAIDGDERRFRELAQALIGAAIPFASPEEQAAAEPALLELSAWVRRLAGERAAEPRDDLISDLVQAHDMGDTMTADEIVLLVTALISAGSETTALGGMVALLTLLLMPDVLERVRADRSLLPQAVNEVLRHTMGGPGGLQRYAVRDVELRGAQVRAGQMLLLSFGGANRDLEAFDDPDLFDIDRDHSNLLSFGHGPHYCLGVHLARTELRCMVDAALDVIPPGAELRLEQLQLRPFGMFSRPVNLPVDFGPAPAPMG